MVAIFFPQTAPNVVDQKSRSEIRAFFTALGVEMPMYLQLGEESGQICSSSIKG